MNKDFDTLFDGPSQASTFNDSDFGLVGEEEEGIDIQRPDTEDTESTLTTPSFQLGASTGGNTIWSGRTSSRRSWIWNHGERVTIGGKTFWQCNLCTHNPQRYADGSTKHPIGHLKLHRLSKNGPIPDVNPNTSIIARAFGATTPRINFNIDIFKQILIQWIVTCHISFNQVQEPSFRLLLSYLTSVSSSHIAIPRALPKSGNTIRTWLMHFYSEHKNMLISYFTSINIVHFTFDLWSSPNHMSLLGLTGHWVGQNGQLCHALLGLRRLHGAHTGENQSRIVFSIIQEYNLIHKVGYFTLDNASNNDKALACLAMTLEEEGVSFNHVESRLRCLGHVINLVVKVFLYGIDLELNTNNREAESENTQENIQMWRGRGPYGRLRNVITFICWTPQRREEFSTISKEQSPNDPAFQPIAANQTRWNGDFLAIKRALHLGDPIDLFIARHLREGLVEDQLTTEDWKELADIVTILEPFHRLTLTLEGHRTNGALYDLIPCMDTVLDHLEDASRKFIHSNFASKHLTMSIKLAWDKLNKYYSLIDNNVVLYASVALHPGIKLEYFELNWEEHPEWVSDVKEKVYNLWIKK